MCLGERSTSLSQCGPVQPQVLMSPVYLVRRVTKKAPTVSAAASLALNWVKVKKGFQGHGESPGSSLGVG